jgi:hypothetical protein
MAVEKEAEAASSEQGGFFFTKKFPRIVHVLNIFRNITALGSPNPTRAFQARETRRV